MRVFLEDFDEWQDEQAPEYDPDELYDELVDEWFNGDKVVEPLEFDDES